MFTVECRGVGERVLMAIGSLFQSVGAVFEKERSDILRDETGGRISVR